MRSLRRYNPQRATVHDKCWHCQPLPGKTAASKNANREKSAYAMSDEEELNHHTNTIPLYAHCAIIVTNTMY